MSHIRELPLVVLLAAGGWGGVARADPSDFIPGEKTVFYDDFSDMAKASPPPHWKVRGAKVDLATEGDGRGLRADKYTSLYANVRHLPEDFTVETDLKIGWVRHYVNGINWRFGNETSTFLSVSLENTGDRADAASLQVRSKHEELGGGAFKVDFDRPLRVNVWLQKGRLRVYVNDDRLVDANQVQLEPIDVARLELKPQSKGEIVLARVRIAESAPDFSETIRSTGRYASHGIHFDVDSDRMQSESQPVLKMIAAGLQADPSLKVRIEGHTDATGSAEHNADLSRRRAEAVRNALASEFKIDPARLTVDGLGSKRPVESNDTPAGRAANRRVEFVRQ